jgi:hypothetical protein
MYVKFGSGIAQSVKRLSTVWTIEDSEFQSPELFPPVVKRHGFETDHLASNKIRIYIATPSYAFMA